MTIHIDESIRAIYYHHFSRKADIMVAVMEKDGMWTTRGRVRYYREDTGDFFKDRDEKKWFDSKVATETMEEQMKLIRKASEDLVMSAALFKLGTGEEPVLIERGNLTVEEFIKVFTEQKFAQTKTIKNAVN